MEPIKIELSGGKLHLTQWENTQYHVESGRVLVYLLPIKDGRRGRRYLLYEAAPGERIPAFCREAPFGLDDPEVHSWRFGLAALDKAVVTQTPCQDGQALQTDFAERAQLRQQEVLGFPEAVLEAYRLNLTRELRNIYKTGEEQEASHANGLGVIYDLFQKKGGHKPRREPTGNHLYDAAACLCQFSRIPIAPLDNIRASCGRKFTLKDIARLSHFICRDVVLGDNWYKRDCGPLLVYTQEGERPIACFPKGSHGYIAFDPAGGVKRKVDRAFANTLFPKAHMLYQPFPNKMLKIKDIMTFGLRGLYKRDLFNLLFFALLGTLIGLLIPMVNEQLYDSFIPMGDSSGLIQVCCVVLACTVGNISFSVVKNLANFRGISAMKYSLQSAVYDRLFNLPESFFRKYDSADLAQRAMGISAIFQMLASVIAEVGLTAVFSLLYLWRMFRYSSRLSGISLAILLAGMALIFWLGWRQLRFEREKLELDSNVSSFMYQLLSGISKVRIAGVENRILYEYLKPYTRSRQIDMTKERYTIWAGSITGAMNTIFSIVLYYVMIHNSLKLSMGAFMGFTTAFGSFSGAMLAVVNSILQVNAVIPAFDRMKPILETLPEIEDDTTLPGDLSGDIEVSHVDFSYDQETGPVLQDLSVHIKPGEYVGIVGGSGCGKSTLFKLLLGFERPQAGKIYYDGRDIDAMDKRELRKKFGVVLQDGGLIAGSIFENITITAPQATMDRVNEVLEEVGLAGDIAEMPMGLHTVVAEGGGTISGGQQQRVLIARAIVGRPKLLFFDEATSALDNATQSLVCESLERLKATRLVIAHRLSTVIGCDRILVMDKGRIVEQGDYQTLMEKRGLFYELASRQIS